MKVCCKQIDTLYKSMKVKRLDIRFVYFLYTVETFGLIVVLEERSIGHLLWMNIYSIF